METTIGSTLWVSPNSDDEFIEGTVIQVLPDGRYAVAIPDGRVFIRTSFPATPSARGFGEMKLWIDDIRLPPPGWEWAKSSTEAIAILSSNVVDEVSFDHDLGGDDTSRRVVIWICENDFCFPPVCRIHSANPVGIDWLEGMINRYGPGIGV